ncbi:MAG TPA: response regulator transcription factor [Vicinamibacterales bacterium]|jgi:two-component system response regulator NreC|nr:response regulator transcription factor [Vicinamibacterales bacterium]
MITVLLAEDHAIVREGLRKVLECEPDLQVVGEVEDGLRVADVAAELNPDVVLLDLGLPGLHGLEVIRRVARRRVNTNVLVLSMYAHEEYVLGAFKNGAAGYIVKGANSREVVTAIRRVATGGRYASPDVSNHLVAALLNGGEPASDTYDTLTGREREVLQLMAEGHSNPDIAARLGISPRTVETHRSNVLRKLDLRTTTEIVRYALRRGILPPD